jgi:RNA polymerase sigma-70 factor (ECF subfamily)
VLLGRGCRETGGRADVSSRSDVQANTFDAFFREAKKPLLAMAFVLTGDLSTAQDLTQEALFRTWMRWSRVAKYDDPQAWTRRVLYNLIVSQRRGDRIRRRPGAEPESTPAPGESHLMLAAALRSLPENQVRALVLHDGAGLSIREVAAEMRVPEGTVKSWLSRGRASAAKAMDPTGSTLKEGHASH